MRYIAFFGFLTHPISRGLQCKMYKIMQKKHKLRENSNLQGVVLSINKIKISVLRD